MKDKLKSNNALPVITLTPNGIETIELYYNCTKCPSQIEILSLHKDNNTIEFKCINKEHQKEIISLKDFF